MTTIAARIFLAFILMAIAYETFSHHDTSHRAAYLNEPTHTVAQVGVCMDKEVAGFVYQAAKESADAFYSVFQMFQVVGECGIAEARINVVEVIDTHMVGDMPIVLAALTMLVGDTESEVVYSVFIGINILPERTAEERADECLDCTAM